VGGLIHLPISEPVQHVLNRLRLSGFKTVIAGGAVRDRLLNKTPQDVDLLTCASLEQLIHLFADQPHKTVGTAFRILLVNGIEIAPPRTRGQAGCDDKESSLNWLYSDLGSRDLTINAMAWDPDTQKLHDPYEGKKDLEQRVVRFTQNPDDRIKEDPVRMIRACRFAAMLDADIEPASEHAIAAHLSLFDNQTAPERLRIEILKAMTLERPSRFFVALKKNNLLEKIFPCLDRCMDLDGGPHHGETVFEHCLLVGDALPAKHPLLRLAGFLHDTGKFDAAAFKNGQLTFPGHEQFYTAAQNDLEALRFSNSEIAYVTALLQAHMRPLNDQTSPKAVRRILSMLERFGLDYKDFMRMRIADKKSNLKKRGYTLDELKIRLKKIHDQMHPDLAVNVSQLKISGNDIMGLLNIAPGPRVGQIKHHLLEQVLTHPELNTKEKLEELCLCLPIDE
jgi:tRNA nucleotidyltransferase (CCA-adding enzyme)